MDSAFDYFLFIMLFLTISLVFHFITAFIVYIIDTDFPTFYTPATFYKLTKMNWFGCIMTYIILFPFGFMFEIGGFVKWIFTVGRK